MSKRFAIILAMCVVLFGGFLLLAKKDANAPTDNNVQPTNHTTGEGKSGVVLVEYGDFQCSACYYYEPVLQEIRNTYKGQIIFQFRHFPLSQIHKNAMASSRAAEAAALQGKFWEMHDKLYQTQDPNGKSGWVAASDPTSTFADYAKEMGLDVEKFKTDLKSDGVNDKIQADVQIAQAFGFSGTPSFTLDGKALDKPADLESFKKVIDEAIKAKTGQ